MYEIIGSVGALIILIIVIVAAVRLNL